MEKLFEQLFKELGYKKKHFSLGYDYYANWINNSFYIIAVFKDFEELGDKEVGWSKFEDDALDKLLDNELKNRVINNCSMIFCVKENEQTKLSEKLIFEIEADILGFKKYVLPYSEKELNDFNIRSSKENKTILQFIHESVNDNKSFIRFKNEGVENYFSLILKLYIKVSNLIFTEGFKSENYHELQKIINSKLLERNFLDLAKKIIDFDENQIDEKNIDSSIQILNLLMGDAYEL